MADFSDLHGVIIVRVIDRLAEETVALAVGVVITSNGNVRADHHLQQIVIFDECIQLHGLPVFHELGPPTQYEVQVRSDDRNWLERIRHQQHVAYSNI